MFIWVRVFCVFFWRCWRCWCYGGLEHEREREHVIRIDWATYRPTILGDESGISVSGISGAEAYIQWSIVLYIAMWSISLNLHAHTHRTALFSGERK